MAASRRAVPDHVALGLSVGCGQAVAAAVVIDGRAADGGPGDLAVGVGVAQAFQDDNAAALAADVAVGRLVECLATTLRREGPDLREID